MLFLFSLIGHEQFCEEEWEKFCFSETEETDGELLPPKRDIVTVKNVFKIGKCVGLLKRRFGAPKETQCGQKRRKHTSLVSN